VTLSSPYLVNGVNLPQTTCLSVSVADPNPDPDIPDPHVFGPPGSGSDIIRKTLISTVL
jgi:hypothetical protein